MSEKKDAKRTNKVTAISLGSIILKAIKYFLWAVLTTGMLFGMAFIVGIFVYIFTGNDIVLKFMADVLTRIIDIRKYL